MNIVKVEITGKEDYRYNAQIWASTDGGKNWCYTGNGRYCRDGEEIAKVAKEYNAINSMCVNCANLGGECGGTTCQTWTGCIYKTTV